MPTSVLLAVLAAAGLLALAPALVRRYDATERLVAERALSTARVLIRCGNPADGVIRRRRRTVPGRRPMNPPRAAAAARTVPSRGEPPATAHPGDRIALRARTVRRPTPAVYRRRRVFAALVLLNVVEVVGVFCVGPSFWMGFAVSGALLLLYLVHLRNRALADGRRRRAQARRDAALAAVRAEERRAYQRRLEARREALRRAAQARAAAQREALRLSQRYGDRDPTRRRGAVRGRPYSQRAAGF